MSRKWVKYDDGRTLGTIGSENGTVLKDEEYLESCRITLEKTERWYAITCGVYGGMVHTAFADDSNYAEKYEAMKSDLAEFIDNDVTYPATVEFYHTFTNQY